MRAIEVRRTAAFYRFGVNGVIDDAPSTIVARIVLTGMGVLLASKRSCTIDGACHRGISRIVVIVDIAGLHNK
jgi:hypothetical protein